MVELWPFQVDAKEALRQNMRPGYPTPDTVLSHGQRQDRDRHVYRAGC